MDELVEVLKGLGYKMPDIKKVLPHIDRSKTIEEQIKEALKLLLKNNLITNKHQVAYYMLLLMWQNTLKTQSLNL